MRITLGIVAICYGLALAGCDPNGTLSSPSTCLADGSVSWWVNPNKEGQVKDTANINNCAVTNTAWKATK
jgi:hypothetical protein